MREPLKKQHLAAHLNGGPPVGLAPITPGTDTTRVAVLDFDSHKGETPWDAMADTVRQVREQLCSRGLQPLLFKSSSGKGVHLYCLWDEPQDAYSVREAMTEALAACELKPGTKGVKHGEVEIFPKQDNVPLNGIGNMVVLPMRNEALPLDPGSYNPIDPETFVNQIEDWPASPPLEKREKPPPIQHEPVDSAKLSQLRAALDAIPNREEHELGYDEWRNVVFAIHAATGGSLEGLALAHEFSNKSTKHDAAFLDERVWPYITERDDGITAQYVFTMAREYGWEEDLTEEFEVLGPQESAVTPNAPPATSAAPSTPVRTAADVSLDALKSPNYLVKGMLDKGSNAVAFGEWNAGKTFVVLNLATHVAAGLPWFGSRVRKNGALYLTYEGERGIDKRMYAIRDQFPELPWENPREMPFGWSVLRNPLTTEQGKAELQAALHAFAQTCKCKPGLVVIDPLQNALGGDDSDPTLMAKLNNVVLGMVHKYGCTVLRVHHSGHADKTRSRGHSSLPAAADTEIQIMPETITAMKQRDDAKGQIQFKLQVVKLGTDTDGDPITTCVIDGSAIGVTTSDKVQQPLRRAMKPPTGRNQRVVLDGANTLLDQNPEDDVTKQDVVEHTYEYFPMATDGTDRRRELAGRTFDRLLDSGHLVVGRHGKVMKGNA